MKDPRQSLKPRLIALIGEGRELAAEPFKPEALRERLTEIARLGFEDLKVQPSAPVDVRSTQTAKAGCTYLAKEGFDCVWESLQMPLDDRANPSRYPGDYYQLVIRIKGAPV